MTTLPREEEIRLDADGVELVGTMCLPSSAPPVPMVLMIAGSGPVDRDENMSGQKLDVFNTVAHALAAAGIGSLRYDKRGCGKSGGDYYRAGHSDLVADATKWLDLLAAHPSCAVAFVLGHSEGCLIAAQLAVRLPRVSGLVLLCPFIEDMRSILLRQAGQLQLELDRAPGISGFGLRLLCRVFGQPLATQRKLLERLDGSTAEVVRVGFQKAPAKWLRELLRMDYAEIFGSIECPMMLLGADKDIQCAPEDVERIAAITKGETRVHRVADLTHVLRYEAGEASFLGVKKLLARPVEPEVLDRVEAWLRGRI